MMPLHCNQGHENQTGSHFCAHCGEPLWPTVGHILEKRYRVVSQLGQGGFGRTYLVEDMHRFNEHCVLKEFAPQVQGRELQKAKELFEREAGALYQLKHPQLPRFREFFQAKVEGGVNRLFLAQDYIEGETYCDLLKSSKQLSEVDVRQFICHLLPVLSYIHSQGVIHRDISPDNLILRRSDHLPVLIDFGGVKQVAATVVSQFALGKDLTRLGKQGYAPEEQMQQGQVFPNSDLYALAVTALILLTAKQPQELYDSYKGTWRWQREIKVSSQLETVLQKMLAYKPSDRYQSAAEVLQALQSKTTLPLSKPNSQLPTVNLVGQKPNLSVIHNNQKGNQAISSLAHAIWLRPWAVKLVGAGLIVLFATSAWAAMNSMLRSKQTPLAQRPSTSSKLSEKTRADKIRARLKALKIDQASFNAKVDKLFYTKHPELRKRSLTTGAKDTAFRQKWYKIAEELLANP